MAYILISVAYVVANEGSKKLWCTIARFSFSDKTRSLQSMMRFNSRTSGNDHSHVRGYTIEVTPIHVYLSKIILKYCGFVAGGRSSQASLEQKCVIISLSATQNSLLS